MKNLASLLLFATMLTGCGLFRPPEETAITNVETFFAVQKRYSDVLHRQIGAGDLIRIVPVVGAIYPIGTPLRAGTASPLTHTCDLTSDIGLLKTGFAPVPFTKSDRSFGANLEIPLPVANALASAINAGVKLDASTRLELNYTDLRQELLPEKSIDALFQRRACRNAIDGNRITVIRGYVHGKQRVSYGDVFTFDPKLSATALGQFSLKYKSDGSFALEDAAERPQFMIISEYSIPPNNSAAAAVRVVPGDSSVNALSIIPVEKLFR